MKKSTLLILFTIHLLFSMNRSLCGQSRDGFWSTLTPFELKTLDMSYLAMNGNPEALLRLAVAASGDIRTEKEFRQIEKSITNFLSAHHQQINEKVTREEQAKRLFHLMNRNFFRISNGNVLNGYRVGQSQFTEMFRSGQFNCISSALLYMILLRYEGFDVEGVVLPGHAFVQIDLPTGKVEVETTSDQGFKYPHTKEQINKLAAQWSRDREITPYTWNDYLNREFVTPYDLIYHNFRNQHTAQNRMSYENRFRLVEMRYHLDKANQQAVTDLLNYYNNESNILREPENKSYVAPFYQAIAPFFTISSSLLREAKDVQLFALLQLSRIHLTAPNDYETALSHLSSFLNDFPISMKNDATVKNNSIYTIQQFEEYLDKRAEIDRYISLLEKCKRIWGDSHTPFAVLYLKLYSQKAHKAWNKGEWKDARINYEKALPYTDSKQEKELLSNIDKAYYNQAVVEVKAGNYKKAKEILNSCLFSYPNAIQCKKLKKKIANK